MLHEHGWVSPTPAPDEYDVIAESLDDWLESLKEDGEIERLSSLRDQIDAVLNDLQTKEGNE